MTTHHEKQVEFFFFCQLSQRNHKKIIAGKGKGGIRLSKICSKTTMLYPAVVWNFRYATESKNGKTCN